MIEIVDTIFSTIVVSGLRAAACHWSIRSETSLVLFDWSCAQFTATLWNEVCEIHEVALSSMRVRFGSVGAWVEGDSLAQAANATGLPSRPIPDWLTKKDYWSRLGQFAASQIKMGVYSDGQAIGNVWLSKLATSKAKKQAFGGVTFAGGERGEDPTVPAFLYGVTLGLDPAASVDPSAQTIAAISRGVAAETAAKVVGALR